MRFDQRFELLQLIRDDGVQTFAVRELATGRALLAHLFVNPRAPINRALLAKLDRLPDEERLRIVDRGVKDGTPYIVTGALDEYGGLREWLVAQGKSAPPPPAETQRLDSAGAWRIVTQAPPPPVPPPGASSVQTPTPLPVQSQPVAPPPLAAQSQPVAPPPTPPLLATRAAPALHAQSAASPPAPASVPGSSRDDRFASLFETPEHPSPTVMVAPPEPSDSDTTTVRLPASPARPSEASAFDTTTARLPAAPPAPPSVLPPPLPQPAPGDAGPQPVGEFAPPPLPPPPLPSPPLPPPPLSPPPLFPPAAELAPASARSNSLLLILGLGGLLLLAVIAVFLFVAFRIT